MSRVSADTGARERLDVIRDALGQYLKASSDPFRWSLTTEDAQRAVRAQAALEALAAGVGVPPDADQTMMASLPTDDANHSVSAPSQTEGRAEDSGASLSSVAAVDARTSAVQASGLKRSPLPPESWTVPSPITFVFESMSNVRVPGQPPDTSVSAPARERQDARVGIPLVVDAEDREMWCERCGRRHGVVWSAPSDVWNDVMREGDRGNPDEFGFCCPTCFMQLADERGVGNFMWMVVPDPVKGPYRTVAGFFEQSASEASAPEGRKPNTAENSAAGVGEARPAEPATTTYQRGQTEPPKGAS